MHHEVVWLTGSILRYLGSSSVALWETSGAKAVEGPNGPTIDG
jgi:hypothetical protein